ncbi:hypothetical protein JW905_16205 [bacterium]|nr:hypothetical protein [candidate division CSSED10-310 bacterium]
MRTRSVVALLGLYLLMGRAQAVYQVGDHINDFTLFDADGKQVSLFDYQNLVIAITFWTPS